eukprot:1847020-Rhodomonas_salina.3
MPVSGCAAAVCPCPVLRYGVLLGFAASGTELGPCDYQDEGRSPAPRDLPAWSATLYDVGV